MLAATPADATPVLLFMGDCGSASPHFRATVDALRNEKALALFVTGDLSYRGPAEYPRFLRETADLPFPVFAVPGDHDRKLDPTLAGFDRVFGGRDRVLDAGPLRVVFLDTSNDMLSPAQLDFLQASLQTPPKPQWTVVLTHEPPYQPDLKAGAKPGLGHSIHQAASAKRFMELLRDSGVTLLACGHEHGFYFDHAGGFPLLVTGGGGRNVERGQRFHYARVTLWPALHVEEVPTAVGASRSLPVVVDSLLFHFHAVGLWVLMPMGAAGLALVLAGRRQGASGQAGAAE
jgi:Icc-related predicted phosphoesterase